MTKSKAVRNYLMFCRSDRVGLSLEVQDYDAVPDVMRLAVRLLHQFVTITTNRYGIMFTRSRRVEQDGAVVTADVGLAVTIQQERQEDLQVLLYDLIEHPEKYA